MVGYATRGVLSAGGGIDCSPPWRRSAATMEAGRSVARGLCAGRMQRLGLPDDARRDQCEHGEHDRNDGITRLGGVVAAVAWSGRRSVPVAPAAITVRRPVPCEDVRPTDIGEAWARDPAARDGLGSTGRRVPHVYEVEFTYGGPSNEVGPASNPHPAQTHTPALFFHFVVGGGVFALNQVAIAQRYPGVGMTARRLETITLAGRRGTLWLGRPWPVGGIFGGHLTFVCAPTGRATSQASTLGCRASRR
jgi:hypothetical protein